jgi:hypothetical protein
MQGLVRSGHPFYLLASGVQDLVLGGGCEGCVVGVRRSGTPYDPFTAVDGFMAGLK